MPYGSSTRHAENACATADFRARFAPCSLQSNESRQGLREGRLESLHGDGLRGVRLNLVPGDKFVTGSISKDLGYERRVHGVAGVFSNHVS